MRPVARRCPRGPRLAESTSVRPAPALAALTIATSVSILATSARADDSDNTRVELASRVDGDAAAGRSYFAPTALTAPEHSGGVTVRLPLYPAIAASFGYGLSDRIELFVGGGAIAIIEDESNHPGRLIGGGVKAQVVRAPRVAVALSASVYHRPAYYMTDPFDDGMDVERLIAGELGVVATACLDQRCAVVASAHAHVMPELAGGDTTRLWGGGSVVAGRGRSRLVVDATIGNEGDDTAFLGYAGYRRATRGLSFDLGALLVAESGDVLPWPTVGLSARF
jgi:hypothetical protein